MLLIVASVRISEVIHVITITIPHFPSIRLSEIEFASYWVEISPISRVGQWISWASKTRKWKKVETIASYNITIPFR